MSVQAAMSRRRRTPPARVAFLSGASIAALLAVAFLGAGGFLLLG